MIGGRLEFLFSSYRDARDTLGLVRRQWHKVTGIHGIRASLGISVLFSVRKLGSEQAVLVLVRTTNSSRSNIFLFVLVFEFLPIIKIVLTAKFLFLL
jgi:hypothetical protein